MKPTSTVTRSLAGLAGLFGAVVLAGCGSQTPAAGPTASSGSAPTTQPSKSPSGTPGPAGTQVSGGYVSWRLPYRIAREGLTDLSPGRVVVAGGMFPDDTSSARAFSLDPATGRSSALPALGTPVHDVAAGSYDGLPAVFGGGNASEQSVVQVLDSTGWHARTHLPTTRSDLSVVGVAGATYVIGGYDGSATPREILKVKPAGGFAVVGTLVEGVRYAATAVVGGKVYVFGGEVNSRELTAVQLFDPATGKTSVVARLPRALGHAVAVAVGNRVLLIGGRIDANTQTAAMNWFDPATGRFTAAGKLPAATSDAAVYAAGQRIWVLGGESPTVTDRVILLTVS